MYLKYINKSKTVRTDKQVERRSSKDEKDSGRKPNYVLKKILRVK